MYLGKIVEIGETTELYRNPRHPYTKALLSAIPIPDPQVQFKREQIHLTGDVPTPINPPSGCRFNTRCPYVLPRCVEEEPKLIDEGGGHMVACHCEAV